MILAYSLVKSVQEYISIAITLDDFALATASDSMLDNFEKEVIRNYCAKLVDPSNKYLNWTITPEFHSGIHLSQPTVNRSV